MIKNERLWARPELLIPTGLAAIALAATVGIEQPTRVLPITETIGELPFKPLPNTPPGGYLAGNFVVSLPKRFEIPKPEH